MTSGRTLVAATARVAAPRGCGWVGLLLLAAWFLPLGVRHLVPSDEGRYAEIAREMFVSGDWVTIRYNGLKYFEKPPLHLWMTVLAYHAFGIGEWQARLWGAVSGLAGLLMTMVASWRWYGPRVAVLAGLVLLASPAWNLSAHFNSLDISVGGALACVLAAVMLAQHPASSAPARRGWMVTAWVAMGVAVLTKGLIGVVLPGLVLVVYTLAARDLGLWRQLHAVPGALAFLAITAPWFVLVARRNPEFNAYFFIHEHWTRYTSTVHDRTGPIWYYVPLLLAGFLPWLGLAAGMGRHIRGEARATKPGSATLRPAMLLATWAAAIVVFFSLSGSKLPGYVVPVFPALALLAAPVLDKLDARAWGRQIVGLLVAAVVGLLATPLIASLPSADQAAALYRAYAVWLALAAGLMIAGLLLAWHLNRRAHRLASIGAYASAMFMAATLALLGHETLGRASSGIDLVPAVHAVLTPQMPIYGVRRLDHTLPFYLQRTMVMVEQADELTFGTRQEPAQWVPTMDVFIARWQDGPRALAVMSPKTYAELRERPLVMFPIAQDARRVVVTNFAPPAAPMGDTPASAP